MKEIEEVLLPDGVTTEMLEEWKSKYGSDKIKLAELPLDDSCSAYKKVIIKVPSRMVQGEFERFIDKNPDKAKEILVNACVLSHKEEVKANDGLFLGAFDAIMKVYPTRVAIVKNL